MKQTAFKCYMKEDFMIMNMYVLQKEVREEEKALCLHLQSKNYKVNKGAVMQNMAAPLTAACL